MTDLSNPPFFKGGQGGFFFSWTKPDFRNLESPQLSLPEKRRQLLIFTSMMGTWYKSIKNYNKGTKPVHKKSLVN
jgi:hypothetical protein